MKTSRKMISCTIAVCMFLASFTMVYADSSINDNLIDVDMIQELDPLNLEIMEIHNSDNGLFITETEGVLATIPDSPNGFITLESVEGHANAVSMSIPISDHADVYEEDNTVFYVDESGSYSVGAQVVEGSARQTFIIASKEAPTRYEIDVDIPDNGYMVFAEINGLTDGSVLVYGDKNEPIAAFNVPWAKDADGYDVKTKYLIEGNKLVQIVEHNLEEINYPVIADPTLTFGDYFSSGVWILRGTGKYDLSLSLTPKALARNSAGGMLGWAKVKARFSSSPNWKNEPGLYDQYICHVQFAAAKSTWNLEPARPNVGITKTIAAGCNPT